MGLKQCLHLTCLKRSACKSLQSSVAETHAPAAAAFVDAIEIDTGSAHDNLGIHPGFAASHYAGVSFDSLVLNAGLG